MTFSSKIFDPNERCSEQIVSYRNDWQGVKSLITCSIHPTSMSFDLHLQIWQAFFFWHKPWKSCSLKYIYSLELLYKSIMCNNLLNVIFYPPISIKTWSVDQNSNHFFPISFQSVPKWPVVCNWQNFKRNQFHFTCKCEDL